MTAHSVGARNYPVILVPYLCVIIFLLVIPSIGVIDASFRKHSPSGIISDTFTLANYQRLFTIFELSIIWQTVKLSAISTLVGASFGYPVAYMLARSQGLLRSVLFLLIMIPFMTSIVVKVLGWVIILGPQGFLARSARSMGMNISSMLYNEYAVLVGLFTFAMPLMIFTLAAAIERIPVALEEAAANLGAGPAVVFFRVIVPLSQAGLLSGALLCFSTSASAYVAPAVLGGRSVRMAGQQVYDQVMVAFNWPGGAALSILLILLLGAIMYLGLIFSRRARRA